MFTARGHFPATSHSSTSALGLTIDNVSVSEASDLGVAHTINSVQDLTVSDIMAPSIDTKEDIALGISNPSVDYVTCSAVTSQDNTLNVYKKYSRGP